MQSSAKPARDNCRVRAFPRDMETAMRRFGLWMALVCLVLALAAPARAADLDIPGVANDAAAYDNTLKRRNPAGGTPQARRTAEQRASDAYNRKDWAAAIAALEQRISLGEENAKLFVKLHGQLSELGKAARTNVLDELRKVLG